MNSNLPYKIEEMNSIKENGAIVDMSNINFPGIDPKDNVRVSMIYLRNTNFNNIELDFSKCSYEFKAECLKFYMTGDINYKIVEYKSTWQKILLAYNGLDIDVLSIMNNAEIKQFIEENVDLVNQIYTFLFSLSYIAMLRLDVEEGAIDFSNIPHCDKALFNNNVYSVIEKEFIDFLYTACTSNSSMWFDEYFTKENEELFSLTMTETPFPTLLYGLTKPEEWKVFVDKLVEQYDVIKGELNE